MLSGDQPAVTGTLVGTLRLGTSGTLAGATLVQMDTPTAQQWYLQGRAGFHQIAVTNDGSLSNQQLRDAVAAALPPGVEALDDQQVAAENQHQFQDALAFITTFLLLFAAVALVVGAFLILNTFSITVAQRTRELALFRALGATRRQLTRSVLVEALLVGLVGSTVGLLLGGVLALGLTALIGAIGARPWRSGPGLRVADGGGRVRRRCPRDAARRVPAGPAGGQGAAGGGDARRRVDPGNIDCGADCWAGPC